MSFPTVYEEKIISQDPGISGEMGKPSGTPIYMHLQEQFQRTRGCRDGIQGCDSQTFFGIIFKQLTLKDDPNMLVNYFQKSI
jgi:hypothetical protein